MMHDVWMDRLSDYLDGGLAPDEASALEAHLAGCQACRTVLSELEGVVAAASQLEDREPAADLWPGILGNIREAAPATSPDILTLKPRTEPAVRRFSFSMPQLLAAAVATMMISGTAVWMTMRAQVDAAPTTVASQPAATADASLGSESAVLISNVEQEYGQAISELQREFDARRDQLDPETVKVVEESLRVIDDAIAEARAALARDPANGYLYRHLDNTMMKKVDLLRRAAGVAVTT
jgi:anti-sigma factor RsiW